MGFPGLVAAFGTLIGLHVRNDANSNSGRGKSFQQLYRFGHTGEMENHPIRVHEVGHRLGGPTDTVLFALFAKVCQQLVSIDRGERTGAPA